MKKLFLITAAMMLIIASPALSNTEDHNVLSLGHNNHFDHNGYNGQVERGRDHGIYGSRHHDGDRFLHGNDRHILREYHGWVWAFQPPMWLPIEPFCREFTVSSTYIDEFGQEYTVEETHIECLDVFGRWILVQ